MFSKAINNVKQLRCGGADAARNIREALAVTVDLGPGTTAVGAHGPHIDTG
jgi:hypothetical protein